MAKLDSSTLEHSLSWWFGPSQPDPLLALTQYLVQQLSLKDAALHNGHKELASAMDSAITRFIDDCGNGRYPFPFPFPSHAGGPPGGGDEPRPILYALAANLNLKAHNMTEDSLRQSFLRTIETLLTRAEG